MGIAIFPAAAGGGVTQKVDIFTSTNTWTAPSNCSAVEVFLVGGGGGGGAARFSGGSVNGGGGGGGGQVTIWRSLSVTPSTAYTVTIGAGGAGGTSDVSVRGAVGTDTTFGSLSTAFGGGSGGGWDSALNEVRPIIKATQGGYPMAGMASGVPAGAGGGAASSVTGQFEQSSAWRFPQGSFTVNSRFTGGLQLSGNGSNAPGLGIDGFGGGGWGGINGGSGGDMAATSIHGGGIAGYGSGTPGNGGNGGTNLGGGGGGAFSTGSTQRNGGNGGSGYAIVRYWS